MLRKRRPEAAERADCGTVSCRWWWCVFSALSPVIHHQLLGLVDVEWEVVLLIPFCQDTHLLSVGTMVDFLKHEGTTDREGQIENVCKNTPASWKAHALSTRPGIPSGPRALRMFTRLKDRVTSATESVSGLTSSASSRGSALCGQCYQPRSEHKRCWARPVERRQCSQ